jgi:hypothetical protein
VNGTLTPDASGWELDDRVMALKLAGGWVMAVGQSRDETKECSCTVRNEEGDPIYHHALVIPAVTREAAPSGSEAEGASSSGQSRAAAGEGMRR